MDDKQAPPKTKDNSHLPIVAKRSFVVTSGKYIKTTRMIRSIRTRSDVCLLELRDNKRKQELARR